jgi:hypothetical protein
MAACHDRFREAGQFDQLAEHGAEQKDREVEFDEADHLLHEDAGEGTGATADGSVSSTAPRAAIGANRMTL